MVRSTLQLNGGWCAPSSNEPVAAGVTCIRQSVPPRTRPRRREGEGERRGAGERVCVKEREREREEREGDAGTGVQSPGERVLPLRWAPDRVASCFEVGKVCHGAICLSSLLLSAAWH